MTAIPWTDATWNPVTGCSKYSEGCRYCYAEEIALGKRKWPPVQGHYPNGFAVTERPDRLTPEYIKKNLKLSKNPKKPRMVFVCDMGDLFHKDVTESYINRVLDVIRANPHHIFQLLTKRADRLSIIKEYPRNAWLGVTVENNRRLDRIEHLLKIDATVRFVSAEPLLEGFTDLSWIKNLDWVIVGGESGDNRREFKAQWARDIRDACRTYGTAFFFKQHGHKALGDDLLDGEVIHEWPHRRNAEQNYLDWGTGGSR